MLKNKVALVTGAAGGIGRACAQKLHESGAKVIVLDMNETEGQKTAEMVDGKFFKLDVTNGEMIRGMMEAVKEEFGSIDILINSAGVVSETKVPDITEKEWDFVIDINLKGTFLMSQIAAPYMIEQSSGKIVNMGSLAGEVGGVSTGVNYAASKAGVISLTMSFAKYLAPHNVNVNCVSPGVIETAMTVNMRNDPSRSADTIPIKRYGTVDDVAHVIRFLCTEEASYLVGTNVDINGGTFMK